MIPSVGAVLGWKFEHHQGICTVGDEIISWPHDLGDAPSRDDIDAWRRDFIAVSDIYDRISRLEKSITDRMWREDAVGSTSVMAFGDGDPRTGKTATQYIGWVNGAIANIRAGL